MPPSSENARVVPNCIIEMNGMRMPAVSTPIASSASTAAFRLSMTRCHNGRADAPQCGQLGSGTFPFMTNGWLHRRQLRVVESVGETDDGAPDMALADHTPQRPA